MNLSDVLMIHNDGGQSIRGQAARELQRENHTPLVIGVKHGKEKGKGKDACWGDLGLWGGGCLVLLQVVKGKVSSVGILIPGSIRSGVQGCL